jgi:hypothetical protein
MSTDQILFGIGLILVLAVGSQVLANQLRIPAQRRALTDLPRGTGPLCH